MAKKFKRYFTGSENRRKRAQPGKGSDRREPQVSEQEIQRNWCRTFGHKLGCLGAACINCGTSAAEITASREEIDRTPRNDLDTSQ